MTQTTIAIFLIGALYALVGAKLQWVIMVVVFLFVAYVLVLRVTIN